MGGKSEGIWIVVSKNSHALSDPPKAASAA